MTEFKKTVKELWDMFDYIEGALYWKHKTISRGRKSIKGGKKVDTQHPDGYLLVGFNSRQYLVHRIIYFMHHGYVPEFLDHIDNDRSNNRIENLRPATKYQNNHNSKLRSDNTSGVKGVNWNKRKNKWQARIYVNKNCKFLGYYDDLELAELVVNEARDKYHLEYANNG